ANQFATMLAKDSELQSRLWTPEEDIFLDDLFWSVIADLRNRCFHLRTIRKDRLDFDVLRHDVTSLPAGAHSAEALKSLALQTDNAHSEVHNAVTASWLSHFHTQFVRMFVCLGSRQTQSHH